MAIAIPEKIIQATLAAGLTTLKTNLATRLGDVFDADVVGAAFITKMASFLGGTPVHIRQGYAIDESKIPGWHVIPSSVQAREDVIGEVIGDDSGLDADSNVIENRGAIRSVTCRILTASSNADVSLALDGIARYILAAAQNDLSEEFGLADFALSTQDFDPIYQYLPENLFYRTTMFTCLMMESWVERWPIINHVHLYLRLAGESGDIEIYSA